MSRNSTGVLLENATSFSVASSLVDIAVLNDSSNAVSCSPPKQLVAARRTARMIEVDFIFSVDRPSAGTRYRERLSASG